MDKAIGFWSARETTPRAGRSRPIPASVSGAAVLCGGEIFAGCNVENASYGLSICAERNAIFQAIAAGHRRIEAIAVACVDAGPTPRRVR